VAVEREDVDVRQGGLKLLGDEALDHGDVVGGLIEDEDLLVADVLGLELGGGQEAEAAHRPTPSESGW
jgi:hypothetical protein